MSEFSVQEWLEETNARYEELKDQVKISKHTLDDCMEEHPALFMEVCDLSAECVSMRDQAKDLLSRTDADAEKDIRKDAANNDMKLTEKQVVAEVATCQAHLDAMDEYLDVKLLSDRMQGLKEVFEQRSRMIKYLAETYIAGYWSDVTAKSPVQPAKNATANKVKKEQASKRKPLRRRKQKD